ncbi:MAG: radical SAM protein [Planctomycetota bacterium]|nr:radical SAM protein [Planctomycetota bacterium]
MPERVRDYLYYDSAVSLCATCYRRVDAKVVIKDDRVYLDKRCADHGAARVLIAEDAAYYRRAREQFLKPSEMPQRFNTPVKWGCPYDCGLCADHEQHSCVSIVEVTDHCNLACPVCYSESGPHRPQHRSLATITAMLDAIVRNEGEPDVVQISGGEPTIHPQFFEIMDAARARPIRHLMLNTNGLRIANEPGFARRLAEYAPGFEIYLQFDSLKEHPLRRMRGADLRDVRRRALDHLNELDLSTTLVVTVQRGVNDGELGGIIDFALEQRCVRGVTLQPIQEAGRLADYDPEHDRLTLTGIRRRVLEQTSVFLPEDIVPVPCHPDCIAMAYAIRNGSDVAALTRYLDPQVLVDSARNTITFERDPGLRDKLFECLSTGHGPAGGAASLKQLLCCLPGVDAPDLHYRDVFRLIIMEFLDAQSFDVRSVRKSCVHIAHPDGRLIPFDTYNLFYRDDLETTRLDPLRNGR